MVEAPEKELRFTRSGQAVFFWLAAAVLVSAGVTLLAASIYRSINPDLLHPLWAVVPLGLAAAAGRLALSLTRHAYVILTPLGIEIFPFFRPTVGMQLVMWQELDHSTIHENHTLLTLHRDAAESSGIHLSLRPIRRENRSLLAKAISGRLSPRVDPSILCAPTPDKS